MKVLALYDKSGPKYHRVLMPVHLMGCEVRVKYVPEEDDLQWADILIFNRMPPVSNLQHSNQVMNVLNKAREQHGLRIVCDMDDHWQLDLDHLLYEGYRVSGISTMIERFMRLADVVTVTHERLAEAVRPINPDVHVLPNFIAPIDQFSVETFPSDKVRLFWAGGITHKKDLEILRGPVQKMANLNVKFVLGGYEKNNVEWAAMASIFTKGGQLNHQIIEALPVNEYYKTYALCDISLIPLRETVFNTYKSNLKILEAANMGVPVVVSRVHPYLGLPDNAVNYVTKQSDWYRHVKELVRSKDLRQTQGELLRSYCHKHFNSTTITEHRRQIFQSLVKSGHAKAS